MTANVKDGVRLGPGGKSGSTFPVPDLAGFLVFNGSEFVALTLPQGVHVMKMKSHSGRRLP